jgi:hypothetical protein
VWNNVTGRVSYGNSFYSSGVKNIPKCSPFSPALVPSVRVIL